MNKLWVKPNEQKLKPALLPKITVIIATYNADNYLEGCIKSIVAQTYQSFELIIIDGGSTDNTISIIDKYCKYIHYWISEPDKGIYDAWNKAIAQARGEWIVFIGSDDILYANAFEIYMTHIVNHPNLGELEFISSNIELVDENLSVVQTVGSAWSWAKFKNQMNTWHVGTFHSQKLFSNYGLFDTTYKISGDYELLLRAKDQLKSSFINQVTVRMRMGGVSNSNLLMASQETYKAKVANGIISPVNGFIFRNIDWIRLHIRKRTGWKWFL